MSTGVRTYLYGLAPAPLRAAFDDHDVNMLIRSLLEAPAQPAPAPRADWDGHGALECGLLRAVDGGYLAGPRLVVVPSRAEGECRELVEPWIERYGAIVGESLPAIQEAYAACAAARRFAWSEVEHALVAGIFMDLAVGQIMDIPAEVLSRHGPSVVWAFGNVSARNAYGVRWVRDQSGDGGLGQVWHCDVTRPPARIEPAQVQLLVALARGGAPATESKDWLYLRYLKFVRRHDTAYRLELPAFLPPDSQRLLVPVMSAARRLRDEAILPALEACARHSWWSCMARDRAYRQAALRLVLEYASDRVVERGWLTPFPGAGEPALAWGRWLWLNGEGPLRLTLPDFGSAP